MSRSWESVVKQYLNEWNKAYVDGNYDQLKLFYVAPEHWKDEMERWQREREELLARGAKVVASRIKAVPLSFEQVGEDKLDVSLSLQQEVEYIIEGISHSHENRRVQKVKLGRNGDEWAFLWPWSWYFDQQPEHFNKNIWPNADTDTVDQQKQDKEEGSEEPEKSDLPIQEVSRRTRYDGQRAAAYAEAYWDSANPAFKQFQDDCTNFISQCLYAGGIPMIFSGSRGSGWWYRGGNWSYSWAVANSLYLLLKSGKAPFYAQQMEQPWQLEIGDIICYDFEGDGRWNHNTIVVTKDENGMPLVDAHTHNSSQRYWDYTDSSAYTPNIKYAFFHIRA